MAETHELRLKIDAGAAESGAKKFRGAIASVRKAVNDLERDTSGAFTSLKSLPKVDVSGLKAATAEANRLSKATAASGNASDRAAENIRKLALQSANALRVSSDQASRLRDRLLSVGDTAGLAKLEAGLARLRTSLTNATSGLDVQESRSQYSTLASELNRTARESERLRAETISAAQAQETAANAARTRTEALQRLRAAHDPLFANSQRYEQSLREIQQLEDAGVMSAQRAAQAREQASQTLMAASAANTRYAKTATVSSMHTANMAAQFNDIGVMLAAGQSPLLLAVQQGTQVSQVLNMMGNRASILATLKSGFLSMVSPVSLVTVGVIALGAAIIQHIGSAIPPTVTFKDAMEDLNESISNASNAASKTDSYAALRDEYGAVTTEVLRLIEVQKQLAQIDALSDLRAARDSLSGESFEIGWLKSLAGYADTAAGRARRLRDELDLTKEAATTLESLWSRSRATNNAEELADLYAQMRETIIDSVGGVENLTGAQGEHVRKLTEAEDAARRTSGAIGGAVDQTYAWAGAMAGVRMEIAAILSSLASIGGGVLSNAARASELTALNAGKNVRAAAVERERFMFNQKMAAKEMQANATGGVAGWAQKQLIDAERHQFNEGLRLDAQLDAAREAARKAAKSSSKGGGGSRKAALTEEQKATEELTKSLKDRLNSLQEERIELDLVASGQFETAEGARAMAEAMVAGGGAVDKTTAAMIRQIDAAAKLNEELKRVSEDPVKKWRESVPTWKDAATEIEMGAINHVRDALSEMIQTGKFDIESLGEAILGTVADIVADKATKELHTLLGGADRENGGLFGGLFGGFKSIGDPETPNITGGEGAGVAQGGAQAAQAISSGMIQAGQQVSQQINAAMTQGGQQAGQQARMGHVQGGQSAANATRAAGMQHGQQVRSATMTSGQQHATKVKTAIETGGQQHAQMIRGASASGGGGGGLLSGLFGGDGIGGILSMAVGAFAEGGMSNSPVGMATAPISAFRHAPHFSAGTPNTSGIPAILHDNEAVVNLTKGRKIPVELNGDPATGAGGGVVNNFNWNVTSPDADSFRRSQKQLASDAFSASRRAAAANE
ncbi:Lambda phage tail tape-measure protein (Tape_meas_lam_C) [Roseovarius pacificus]|uniref:Lambda phage tail tape-measure protein (Tape_meas_lam_C) n=1 Tax=Roseovarius pacificus TaxID=337701 RepID=A0A1M6YWI2_9RHOB|nr:phage tail length tape measure family protein [Roseovarius pacificus]GGO50297.1 hypothetical protein GCM10011315_00730 [Roseovarius pacificus]SHL22432.1 Lambda phage tail tape-measure protein (Tape_meas_lam_C) [Roseovarius pacificus]